MANEVVKKEENAVPAHLKTTNKEELGINGIKPQDIVLPRIKIVQQSSSTAKKANKELREGMYYDNISHKSYGEKISFFPVLMYSSLVWFNSDLKFQGSEKEDIATGEKVFFGDEEFCKNNKPKESFNYMIVLDSDLKAAVKNKQPLLPTLFSCISSARSNARKLNRYIWSNGVEQSIPIYGQIVNAGVEIKEFTQGPAYNPTFKFGRYATEEEFAYLKEMHKKCVELQSVVQEHDEAKKPEDAPTPPAAVADDENEVPF